MAKFKVDLSGAKQFLFHKGEKVGLVSCTIVMILVVAYSLWTGLASRGAASGKPWNAEIKDLSDNLRQQFGQARLREEEKPAAKEIPLWVPGLSFYNFAAMFPLPDKAFTKKLNPQVLSLYGADVEKSFQVDYVRGLYYAYEIDPATQKVTVIKGEGGGEKGGGVKGMNIMSGIKGQAGGSGGISNLAKIVRPTRLVVVSGVFPMWQQLDEFRKALRYASVEELLAHRDELPKPLGIEVQRTEILPDGKNTGWKPILSFDKKGRVVIDPSIKAMMREMMIDEHKPQETAAHVFSGLVTPLPKMANAKYAKIELVGLEVKEIAAEDAKEPAGGAAVKKGLGPAVPGGNKPPANMENKGGGEDAGAEIQLRKEAWNKLTKELQDKFMERYSERYSIFEPLGVAASSGADKKTALGGVNALGKPPGGNMMQGKEGSEAGGFGWDIILGGTGGGGVGAPAAFLPNKEGEEQDTKPQSSLAVKPTDALVRFFDPDVQPGKTYVYSIRVRMANPNFGKRSEVAYQALADQEILDQQDVGPRLGWQITPPITIPGDYYWYALDQEPKVKIKDGADFGIPPYRPETTPIQVHRWMDRVSDVANGREELVADWAIAERLYVRRGEPVGRHRVMLEMPTWRIDLQAFSVGFSAQAAKGKPKANQPKEAPHGLGMPVDLVTTPPALVVDFEGGKKTSVEKRDGTRDAVFDASAFEVLVLTPDNRLVARNSRADLDPETPAGSERVLRYELWRDRLQELRDGPGGGAGGGIVVPGAVR